MPIGIADVATDLVLVLFRRRQELSTARAPFGVHGLDVLDPYVEEAADPVGVAWCLQSHRGLVVRRASADVDDDPAIGERDIGHLSGEDHPAAKYFGVETPRPLNVVRDDEVAQDNPLRARRKLGHRTPPLVGKHPLSTAFAAGVMPDGGSMYFAPYSSGIFTVMPELRPWPPLPNSAYPVRP